MRHARLRSLLTSMPTLPPPPPPSAPTGAGSAVPGGRREPEIVVMPEKYFGVALKMDGKTAAEMQAPLPPPPKPVAPKPPVPPPIQRRPIWPFVVLIIILLLAVAGGFVWFNRDILFPKPAPIVNEPPVQIPAPSAPTNLTASVASGTQAVALAWVDTSSNEVGFRIERQEGNATFIPVTNLPANSSNFLDISVQNGRSYSYRVIATGQNAESGPSNIATVSVAPSVVTPPSPTLPPGGLDSDSDGLSDVEEPLYGSDASIQDSDKDGFLDGNEVFHLYNPSAIAPVRLADSGLVTPFVAPAGWSILIPKGWTSSLDTADGSIATVRTNQGESFKIRIEDNPLGQSVTEWYLAKNPNTASTAVRLITTRGGLEGLLGAERLDAYFAWDGKIFSLSYDIGTKPFINFRTTYEMILNSLRLSGAPVLDETKASEALNGPGDFLETSAASSTVTSTEP